MMASCNYLKFFNKKTFPQQQRVEIKISVHYLYRERDGKIFEHSYSS